MSGPWKMYNMHFTTFRWMSDDIGHNWTNSKSMIVSNLLFIHRDKGNNIEFEFNTPNGNTRPVYND